MSLVSDWLCAFYCTMYLDLIMLVDNTHNSQFILPYYTL